MDDLVAWLIGRLADAGYQKLSTLLRGSDQQRALKQAVTAAAQATVREISPCDEEEAERVAKQINRAFHRREPVALPPGQSTLLEALQAGIAGQLSVLYGSAQQSASLLRVPVSEVAGKLTGHLIRQIQIRGSRGGPLAPLAGQLNHDVTHLQGQRIEGMLARVLDWLGDALAPPGRAQGPVGWPLAEMGDPFALEVHRPVDPDVPRPGLPALPAYVPRGHDDALVGVVMAAAAGVSGIAVLVGGSSTGKTRACWQALDLLRGQEPGWRLWHPVDPHAALAGLRGIGPRTVVWLNEAQRHLSSADSAGERAAAGLRELTRSPGRGPVLVLATLWPQFWAELTTRPPGDADPHAQARELLVGHDIPVPSAFTGEQLRQMRNTEDPRLAQAAVGSRDGQVIQYLAGAPELLVRYHHASAAARALIHAAMDARRLGMRPALPRAFLETAAPGYLTDADWDLLPDDWLDQALDDAAKPAKGIRGPLAPIRPRPTPGALASTDDRPAWQLADYLDQHGRRARREQIPPEEFWAAAVSYADTADLTTLAWAAEDRGLYRDAARLDKQASAHGDPLAGARLVRLLHSLHPGDQRPADWAAAHASLDNPGAVARLLGALREAGAADQATALLDRDPAAHASLDDMYAVARLLEELRDAGAADQVAALLDRDPAAHASLDDQRGVSMLLRGLREAGAADQATALASRAAASLDNPAAVARLLEELREAGAADQVAALLDRDPAAHASLDDPDDLAMLLKELRKAGAVGQATALASRAAAQVSLDDPAAVARRLEALRWSGAADQVAALLDRDPAAHASLDDPAAVAGLLRALRAAGAADQVAALLDRDPAAHGSLDKPAAVATLLDALRWPTVPGQVAALLDRDPAAHASLDDLAAVARLLEELRKARAADQVTALACRAAAHASLDNPGAVARLLEELRKARAADQVTALASRAAAHASLDNPGAVAGLLRALREAGAADQVTALASRAAAHASLGSEGNAIELLAVWLLEELREAGALAQAAELIERLPAAGLFDLFSRQEGRQDQFRFGREADCRPAKRWTWTDLG